MFDRLRQWVLSLLRLPPAPTPPIGAPGSVRIFRAGKNYYFLQLAQWSLGQFGAATGIIVSLTFLTGLEIEIEARQARAAERKMIPAPRVAEVPPSANPLVMSGPFVENSPQGESAKTNSLNSKSGKSKRGPQSLAEVRGQFAQAFVAWPRWTFPLIRFFEYVGILGFLVQIPLTFAAVRLRFELHWYIVTDRSLRIRTGLMNVQETTMSFANLQQVSVAQGPLQRLLGIADVQVQSAGGGGGENAGRGLHLSLHLGRFHGVDNANEIRDLILDRLRSFRTAGLGDPDEKNHPVPSDPAVVPTFSSAALTAARELLTEARALRQALSLSSPRTPK